jgi:hypothetical protein
MPIPLGVLAVAGAGAAPVPAGNAYEWLETVSVGSGGQASVSFSNLNSTYGSTYQHLQVRITFKGETANTESLRMRLNSDTGSNYNIHAVLGDGSAVSSFGLANQVWMTIGDSKNTANAFTGAIVDVLDAFETTKFKTIRVLSGTSEAVTRVDLASGAWRNTNAITDMSFFMNSGTDIAQFSRISLYGMRSG